LQTPQRQQQHISDLNAYKGIANTALVFAITSRLIQRCTATTNLEKYRLPLMVEQEVAQQGKLVLQIQEHGGEADAVVQGQRVHSQIFGLLRRPQQVASQQLSAQSRDFS
jgi:hypothetical protein